MDHEELLRIYHEMVLTRRPEERSATLYQQGKIRGFCTSTLDRGCGNGVLFVRQPEDRAIPAYRDHGIALACGMPPRAVMAELLGKSTGCSRGMGGSMHLADPAVNFCGGHAIVGAHLPLAAGMALAERLPPSRFGAAIDRRMTAAKREIPHVYPTNDLNAAPLVQPRREINAHLPEDGQLSVNDWVVKAAALALRDMPGLNVSLEGDGLVRHSTVNIGIAIAVEEGLLTIAVCDAVTKPVRLMAAEVREMAQRAREGRVQPQNIEGSTFTISNLGMLDVEHVMAIITPPRPPSWR